MTWRPPLRESTAAPELDVDMTPDDIVHELAQLKFEPNQFRKIKIDEPVRDFFLTRVAPRRA